MLMKLFALVLTKLFIVELYTVLLLQLALCSAVKTIAPHNAHGEHSGDATRNKVMKRMLMQVCI
jgi:hypothetical protein